MMVREVLKTNRTLFVAPAGIGSDDADGLTPETALASLKEADNRLCDLDARGFSTNIQMLCKGDLPDFAGDTSIAYFDGLTCTRMPLGTSSAMYCGIYGSAETPQRTVIRGIGKPALTLGDSVFSAANRYISNLELQCAMPNDLARNVELNWDGGLVIGPGTRFGSMKSNPGDPPPYAGISMHMWFHTGGRVRGCVGGFKIVAGASQFILADMMARASIHVIPIAIELSDPIDAANGYMTISNFLVMRSQSQFQMDGLTFPGANLVRGARHSIESGSIVNTGADPSSYFPGNSAGVVDTASGARWL